MWFSHTSPPLPADRRHRACHPSIRKFNKNIICFMFLQVSSDIPTDSVHPQRFAPDMNSKLMIRNKVYIRVETAAGLFPPRPHCVGRKSVFAQNSISDSNDTILGLFLRIKFPRCQAKQRGCSQRFQLSARKNVRKPSRGCLLGDCGAKRTHSHCSSQPGLGYCRRIRSRGLEPHFPAAVTKDVSKQTTASAALFFIFGCKS